MNIFMLVILILPWSAVAAQVVPPPGPPLKAELSIRDQIKAQRAKEDAAERSDPLGRPWDRDADGKRPWERVDTPRERHMRDRDGR
jgi:hypothetical protein